MCKWTDHVAYQWLQTPLGRSLLVQEARVVEEALDGIFGEQMLQLGHWGDARTFLRYSRTQRSTLIAEQAGEGHAGAVGELHRLPVESDSIDSVLLPHTLDYSDKPHAILREVDRVLRSDGHLVVLGFRPGGLWGLRRLIPGAAMPPGDLHLVPDRRLRDWLKLLDMRIHGVTGYFFRWPLSRLKGRASPTWERRGQRWWPEVSACYLVTAQKRVSTLTPVRPVWRKKPKVVAGLAEPSTRVSRVRFDRSRP
ncbi:MAG: methyltransferase domain-containing protein [Woeseiaceae bacterium]|nr:methyltransferase domain-containing protein [Woeseiaceae bacterium]